MKDDCVGADLELPADACWRRVLQVRAHLAKAVETSEEMQETAVVGIVRPRECGAHDIG